MKTHQLHALIEMVNQIASNITSGVSQEQTAKEVASHLGRFWSRSMKSEIIEYLNSDGSELSETSKAAVAILGQAA